MSTSSRLWRELGDKAYREQIVTEQAKRAIPFQIRALLASRGYSQKVLAERAGLHQGAVSRAADLDYGNLTLNTIVRLAAGFDVAFVGEFVPFSRFVDYMNRLPTLGDGRQSGTSDSPSILNASPESAVGGGLSWLRTGDIIRIDLAAGRCDALVDDAEIARRRGEGAPAVPPSHTPWEEIYREKVGQLEDGAVLEMALKYRRVSERTPRHNH